MHKIQAVSKVYKKVDSHILSFQHRSGLNCIANCGMCCTKTNIQATILEFLPAAYHLFITGQYLETLDKMETYPDDHCIFFDPFSPGNNCSSYHYRGLICRLFGFSVQTDKYGEKTFLSCKPLKTSEKFQRAHDTIGYAPVMSSYYMQLIGIDPKLSVEYHPINQAIKKALEIIILHFQYRKKPA